VSSQTNLGDEIRKTEFYLDSGQGLGAWARPSKFSARGTGKQKRSRRKAMKRKEKSVWVVSRPKK